MASDLSVQVSVVYSPSPRDVREVLLTLPAQSTVLQALQLSGLLNEFPELDTPSTPVGVWGRKASWSQQLREHDRVEIYRALKVDPKVARRERFVKQGAKGTGLFARKRPGSAAGY
jgi:putative ubiquitin-RnfH superfamily antitoxin RatB of RatAB toxin-antitoxin module